MSTPQKTPCVFVFHQHALTEPAPWILKWSQQLREHGINVLLDVWELKIGQDIYAYLETAVTDSNIEHILLMIDETYLAAAKNKIVEQLIRPILYENAQQEKIIPIIQLSLAGKQQLPPYLKSRWSIDYYEEKAYEKVVRILYKVCEQAPPIGSSPDFLATPFSTAFSAAPYLQSLKTTNRLDEESQAFFEDFTEAYQQATLEGFSSLSTAWQEWLEYTVGTRKSPISIDTGLIIETLENLQQITTAADSPAKKLLLHELFLVLVIIGFKKRNFKFLGKLLQGTYYNKLGESSTFVTFNNTPKAVLAALQQDQAEELTQYLYAALSKAYKKKEIVEADLMCYYIALMQGNCWVPFLAAYQDQATYPISWLMKLDMKQFFNKTKALYGVEEAPALRKKMSVAFLLEAEKLPLPYKVLPLQETGLPRLVNTKE